MPRKKVTIAELTVMDKPTEERLTITGGSAALAEPSGGTEPGKKKARKTASLDKQDGDNVSELEDDVAQDDEREEAKRFRMLGYSGAPVSRWYGKLAISLDGMSCTDLPMPALLGHVDSAVAGVIESFDITDAGLMEEGRFITSESGDKVKDEMAQDVPYKASIGVRCLKAAWLDDDLTLEINGREIEGPCEVWLESEVYETSFTVIPADSKTSVDILSAHQPIQEATMPKPTKADDDVKVVAQVNGNAALEKESGTPVVPDAESIQPGKSELSSADVLSLASEGSKLGLTIEEVRELSKDHATTESLGRAMLRKASEKNPAVSTGQTMFMGADESERFNSAVADGILLAHGYKFGDDKPAEGASEFRRLGLQQILRECLSRMGQTDAYRIAKTELAQRVISIKHNLLSSSGESLGYGGSSSIGDFSNILGSVLHRRLMSAYQEAPATFMPIVTVTTASDFRDMYGVSLSEAPDLLPVMENGEYKEAYFRDKQEVYSISKHGRICSLTFEMIINDDLRAFLRVPQLMGNAARRLESDLVWHKILSNPTMAEDSKTLFHADHNNLLTGAAPSTSALDAAYEAMMMQRGFNSEAGQYPSKKNAQSGALLTLTPKTIAVPPALKSNIQVLIRSMANPESDNSGVVNVYQNDLDIIVEPRLQVSALGGSSKNWFLFADPGQIDTIEIAYLEGEENPLLTSYEPFATDGVSWKIRHIFGCGAMDYRGMSKNPGPE